MNREIKFRYFDPEHKVMVTEDMPLPKPTWVLHNRMEEPYGNYVLMQYTGLKDKNGKEIYEGDIIETENSLGVHKFAVEYNDDKAGYFCPHWVDDEYETTLGQLPNHIEIIGNIFENPELLKSN